MHLTQRYGLKYGRGEAGNCRNQLISMEINYKGATKILQSERFIVSIRFDVTYLAGVPIPATVNPRKDLKQKLQ